MRDVDLHSLDAVSGCGSLHPLNGVPGRRPCALEDLLVQLATVRSVWHLGALGALSLVAV